MERRQFNARERVALYLAANGMCQSCGVELEPGWHADHTYPYSKGGATDVMNGSALCATCNLSKGDKTIMTPKLSKWQTDALEKFRIKTDDFLAVATPGSGKTRFALACAVDAKAKGYSKIVVVVPNSHLRQQWANAAAEFGINLDPTFENGNGAEAPDYDGIAVTYAAVHSAPMLYRRLSGPRALVIFDEVHHVGDQASWGSSMLTAFDTAGRRLLLSGTPNRSDGTKIPFVRYDDDGYFVEDYLYGYGEAVSDKRVDGKGNEFPVVRLVEFRTQDGTTKWMPAGEAERTINLADAGGKEMSNSMRSALDPSGKWVMSVLRAADAELTKKRATISDSAGLVVARDQYHARKYAAMLARVTGEQPTLAVSDDPSSGRAIADFARASSRWIVAVNMVSEGVDIPRLAVGVYATNVRTETFFRQVVGRVIRSRGPVDIGMSVMFIPAIKPMVEFASEIEKTVRRAVEEREEEEEHRLTEGGGQRELPDIITLPSGEAVPMSTIVSGDSYSPAEVEHANNLRGALGLDLDALDVVRLIREHEKQAANFVPAPVREKPLNVQKDELRAEITTLVGKVAKQCYGSHKAATEVNTDLRYKGFPQRSQATLDQLRQIKLILGQCLTQRRTVA